MQVFCRSTQYPQYNESEGSGVTTAVARVATVVIAVDATATVRIATTTRTNVSVIPLRVPGTLRMLILNGNDRYGRRSAVQESQAKQQAHTNNP